MSSCRNRGGELVTANHFQLSGDGLDIVLGPGIPGPLRFGYRAAPLAWCFGADEVTSDQAPWGRSVSVTVAYGPEDGDTATLTVLVPRVRVGVGGRTRVRTLALTASSARPPADGTTPGQFDRLSVVELAGSASFAPPDPDHRPRPD